jgi:hypothetical protein
MLRSGSGSEFVLAVALSSVDDDDGELMDLISFCGE